MISVKTNSDFLVDINEVVNLFGNVDAKLNHELIINDSQLLLEKYVTIINIIKINDKVKTYEKIVKYNDLIEQKRLIKREIKLCIYKSLSKFLHVKKPWGSLTGIRPTRLAYELINHGTRIDNIESEMNLSYLVSKQKCKIVKSILTTQEKFSDNEREINFYVHIPFCPSRCSYCSFICFDSKKSEAIINQYIEALIKEIEATKKIIKDNNYKVKTVYIGGGTPSTLSASQLEKIFKTLSFKVSEFTVECGRPDTVTKEKLNVLKNHNVTRVCLNPQTFNDETLKLIGRKHTIEEFYNALSIVKEFNFDLNIDLIAGLPLESFKTFKNSLKKAIEIFPENLTVHTLSLKNGASLNDIKKTRYHFNEKSVKKMIDYSIKKLKKAKYSPYYLYRQKNQIAYLENIGFTKFGKNCVFNIESMEEVTTTIACGAGAITKRIFRKSNRIERFPNAKNIEVYLEKIDEIIEKKIIFFQKDENL